MVGITISRVRVALFFATYLLVADPYAAPAMAQSAASKSAETNAASAKLVEVLKIGDTAKDVEFQPLRGEVKTKLSDLTKDGPVVLVVLRGFPGYQCPFCTRQMAELRRSADDFVRLNAKVVLVYPGPGPADSLKKKAEEFLAGVELPRPFQLMIDPEYSFTNSYELRWNARNETSYPTTLVLDSRRVVRYRKVSLTHGDRAPTKEVIAALESLRNAPAVHENATDK